MSEHELQFHYFKMFDTDNNKKLDGLEILKAITHVHSKIYDYFILLLWFWKLEFPLFATGKIWDFLWIGSSLEFFIVCKSLILCP